MIQNRKRHHSAQSLTPGNNGRNGNTLSVEVVNLSVVQPTTETFERMENDSVSVSVAMLLMLPLPKENYGIFQLGKIHEVDLFQFKFACFL